MERKAHSEKCGRITLSAALQATAIELEAEHENCKAIEIAFAQYEKAPFERDLSEQKILQMLDRHTQIVADIADLLHRMGGTPNLESETDVTRTIFSLKLISLRDRIMGINSENAKHENHSIEIF